MSGPGPFRPRTVLAVLLVGGVAFLLLLYAIGAGLDARNERDGGAHAASTGLTGFAGLADLLGRRGHAVSLSRSLAASEEAALLVLTPPHAADGEEIWSLIAQRRYVGPTLLILPKWIATPLDPSQGHPPGWVALLGAVPPPWASELGLDKLAPAITRQAGWRGHGLRGRLPEPGQAQAMTGAGLVPLLRGSEDAVFAGYHDDTGYYPILTEAAGMAPGETNSDESRWPVVIVSEPDLLNNYGLADQTRARAAVALVEATLEDHDLPIVFDLTLPGLGQAENLLTLAYRPPFLAATLCLLLAALVVAWRAFLRFGPPLAEAPALARGKGQLARNGASLVERTGRLHLLGRPYGALVTARIAAALGLRETDPELRAAAIARVLAARGHGDIDYAARLLALQRARRPGELLRAAGALRTIERTLTP